jgi:DNA-binding LacI/PurR family transcriptional regulator
VTAPPRVTSHDVAREAGVSRATVSYVLNQTPGQTIPEPTRERVLAAASRLGYTPSAAARTLRRGRSDLVLLLLPDWPIGHSVALLIHTLTHELARHGLSLLVHHGTGEQVASPTALLGSLSPAAVVAVEALSADDEAALQAAGIAVVVSLFDDTSGGPAALMASQVRVGRLQVEHLASQGHERLAVVLPSDPRVRRFAEPRLEGARMACGELGLDQPPVTIIGRAEGDTIAAIEAWRAQDPAVTAVCAYNDEVAMAVLAAVDELGLRAPDDLAVIGVDDIPVARYAHPPLTTVTVGAPELGRYLADAVARSLAGEPAPAPPSSTALDVVVRRSA